MAHSNSDQAPESVPALPGDSGPAATQPHPKHFSNKGGGRGRAGSQHKKRDMGRSEWRYKAFFILQDLLHCFGLTAKVKPNQTNENATTTSKQQKDRELIEGMPHCRSTLPNSQRTILMLRKGDPRRRSLFSSDTLAPDTEVCNCEANPSFRDDHALILPEHTTRRPLKATFSRHSLPHEPSQKPMPTIPRSPPSSDVPGPIRVYTLQAM